MLEKIRVSDRQTVFDIALQLYGSVEGIAFLLEDNPALELDEALVFGQQILFRPNEAIQKKIIEQLNYPTHG